MKENDYLINQAIERMAVSLEPKHWQAFVAALGISYPHTFYEKKKILKEMINKKEVKNV